MLGHRTLNVQDYLTILKRRWWIVVIPAILLAITGYGATYFMTPQYVSSTLVLIDEQKVPTEFVKPVATEALDSRLAYMQEKILSRSSIEPIIKQYNLYGDQKLSMDARVDLTRKALKIDPVESQLARTNGLPGFRIAFTANDPQTAQQVCSKITGLFTAENVKSRQVLAAGATDFLQEQLDQAKRTLDDQGAKIAEFEQKNFGSLQGDVGNNVNIMSSLTSRLDSTTQAIQALEQNKSVGEALLAQQSAMTPGTTAAVAEPRVQEAQLEALEKDEADLTAKYTPDYPDVKAVHRKIQELRAQMAKAASAPPAPVVTTPSPNHVDSAATVQIRAQLRGIDVQIQAKQREQDDLKRQIQQYESRIQASPQVEAEYKALTRDSGTAETEYNRLKEQMNQSQMTIDLEHRQQGETFTLLDEANLPTEATFPKPVGFAAGGFGAGLALGLMIVAFLEYRDTALRTEAEVWDFTHLPTLAVIAWSGDAIEVQRRGFLKRIFSRKANKEALADA
jgi:polysaccharide chain length determinant protein (PEP-CTERM system associated)